MSPRHRGMWFIITQIACLVKCIADFTLAFFFFFFTVYLSGRARVVSVSVVSLTDCRII